MKKAKKIFIGILSMVLLVGGTVNNTVAKEYVTGTYGGKTFKITYLGSVYLTAGVFHNYDAIMSNEDYYKYDEMELYMIMFRNSETNYTKKSSSTNCSSLTSWLKGDDNLAGIAYLKSTAKDDLYGSKTDDYTFAF